MKPISDKWLESWAANRDQGRDVDSVKIARELQRVRAEIRAHRVLCWGDMPIDETNATTDPEMDVALYRSTLPEGDK